jgi:hypothetical protein
MRRQLLLVFGFACLYAVSALSDTARNPMPANCKEKQSVQLLSSGDPVEGDASKITCTVRYWVCGQNFTQTQVTANQPGACERFTGSIRSKIGGEACCDCFPKCTASDAARRKPPPPAASEAPMVKADSRVEQLEQQVRQLEAQLKSLEEKLGGDEVTLNVAASSIKIRSDKTGAGIVITSDQDISIVSSKDVSITSAKNVSIKASGNVVLKGAKIQQN